MSEEREQALKRKRTSGTAVKAATDKDLLVQQLPRTLGKLRLRDLETLDLLARTRSFARTAEVAAITQPALSKWLRELEQAIGLPLFERTTRHVAPTIYGDAMLECIARILTDLRGVKPTWEALRLGANKPVTIGTLPNMGPLLIPGTIEYLKTHDMSIQINLREDTLDRLLPQAQRRELDLLVCRLDATAHAAGLAVQPLYRDEMVVVCGTDHPLSLRDHVTWRDAHEFPWIAPPHGSPMRVALEAEFAHAGLVMPEIVLESVSHSANCAVVQRIPCLFVSSQRGLTETRGAEPLRRLPLVLSMVSKTVGVLYSEPCGTAVAAVLAAITATTAG